MAKTYVLYNDPNNKKLCRIVHSGADSKPQYQFKVEEEYTNEDEQSGWQEARSRFPYEIVLAVVADNLVRGKIKGEVGADGHVRIDARACEFPLS